MSIDIRQERGVLYLHFGSRWIQGAMRIARPSALELEYTREMLLPLLLAPDGELPRRVLQIGLGAGSLTRFLHRHFPSMLLSVVETDERVIATAREFFRLPDDPSRIRLHVAEGSAFVGWTDDRYDLLLVDGYDAHGRVGALDSVAFYRACRARLGTAGILATNLVSGRRGTQPSVARMRLAFDDRVVALPPCRSGNTVVLASARTLRLSVTEVRQRAEALKQATGLNMFPTLSRYAQACGPQFAFG